MAVAERASPPTPQPPRSWHRFSSFCSPLVVKKRTIVPTIMVRTRRAGLVEGIMAVAKKRRSSAWPSTVVAAVLVAGAGLLAWYGLAPDDAAGPPTARETRTIAPAAALAADEVTAGSAPLARGLLPTRIVVPSAGIDTAVTEVGVVMENGTPVWETAWKSAGHHIDSARPGQPGNMVIAGHVSVADRNNVAVFRTLNVVKPGDVVEVEAGGVTYRYLVDRVAVTQPTALNVLRSDHSARVTLITCTPDLKLRLVVSGRLV